MANHAWATFRKNIDLDQLVAILRDFNRQRFQNCLVIRPQDDGILVESPEGRRLYYWRASSRRLEWAHTWGDVEWWLCETLAHHMARQFDPNCVIRDEGISDKMRPTFDVEYPTPREWMAKPHVPAFVTRPLVTNAEAESHPSYWKAAVET